MRIVSELSDEIKALEERINNANSPEPHIFIRIQESKLRLEIQIEKEELKRANKAFDKMNLEGEKTTKYFCSLEKQMKKATLLDSLLIENEQKTMEEIVDQSRIEKEVKCFL